MTSADCNSTVIYSEADNSDMTSVGGCSKKPDKSLLTLVTVKLAMAQSTQLMMRLLNREMSIQDRLQVGPQQP